MPIRSIYRSRLTSHERGESGRSWTESARTGIERRFCSAAGMRARLATSVSGRRSRRPGVFLSNSIVYSGPDGTRLVDSICVRRTLEVELEATS